MSSDIRARDPAELIAKLSIAFGSVDNFQILDDPRTFAVMRTGMSYGYFGMCRTSGSGFQFETELSERFVFYMSSSGHCSMDTGAAKVAAVPRQTALVVAPGRRTLLKHESGAVVFGIVASLAALQDRAREALGRDVPPLDPQGVAETIDLTCGVGAALGRNLLSVFSETSALIGSGLTQAASGLNDFLLSLLTLALYPAVCEGLRPRRASAGNSAFDRAVEHLTARAAEPVSLTELAQDLGVSLRSLQIEFQRRLGRSPLEFLFERRLELARTRLLAVGSGLTVTEVASQCGFTNIGGFAARYRETYGELPSETLTRVGRR